MLSIKEYPESLYCRGNTDLLKKNKIVAIVGSRNCSEYGRKYARLFAKNLAKRKYMCNKWIHEDDAETLISGFPKRNRIITGIADAVLVIEACPRSGSKVSAEYAFKQGKKVYCIQ